MSGRNASMRLNKNIIKKQKNNALSDIELRRQCYNYIFNDILYKQNKNTYHDKNNQELPSIIYNYDLKK